MRRIFAFFLFLLCILPPSLRAKSGEVKATPLPSVTVLHRNEVVDGDFFARGNNVEIAGVVKGDAYIAGGQVFIEGTIEGDLLVMGGNIDLSGTVLGNVRALAGQMQVSGDISKNATLLTGNVNFSPKGNVQGNLVSIAGTIDLSAPIDGNVKIISSNTRISNIVRRSIDAVVGKIRFTSSARVDGDVIYKSREKAIFDPGSQVYGEVHYKRSFVNKHFDTEKMQKLIKGSKIVGNLMNLFYTLIIGVIFIKFYPQKLSAGERILNKTPIKAFGAGVAALIVLPLISVIMLVTVLGAPFAITLIGLNIMGFYSAKMLTIYWLSSRYTPNIGLSKHPYIGYFCASLIYFLLCAVPVLSYAVSVGAMLIGFGATVLAASQKENSKRAA